MTRGTLTLAQCLNALDQLMICSEQFWIFQRFSELLEPTFNVGVIQFAVLLDKQCLNVRPILAAASHGFLDNQVFS